MKEKKTSSQKEKKKMSFCCTWVKRLPTELELDITTERFPQYLSSSSFGHVDKKSTDFMMSTPIVREISRNDSTYGGGSYYNNLVVEATDDRFNLHYIPGNKEVCRISERLQEFYEKMPDQTIRIGVFYYLKSGKVADFVHMFSTYAKAGACHVKRGY